MSAGRQPVITLPDGRTTRPLVGGTCYIGNALHRVGFDYLRLPDGRFALHSAVCWACDERHEDFDYRVVAAHRVVAEAVEMLNEAAEFIDEQGGYYDGNTTPTDFIGRLQQEASGGLH